MSTFPDNLLTGFWAFLIGFFILTLVLWLFIKLISPLLTDLMEAHAALKKARLKNVIIGLIVASLMVCAMAYCGKIINDTHPAHSADRDEAGLHTHMKRHLTPKASSQKTNQPQMDTDERKYKQDKKDALGKCDAPKSAGLDLLYVFDHPRPSVFICGLKIFFSFNFPHSANA